MLILKSLCVWAIAVEITLCLSPAAIVAIAKIQNKKVKTIASALNWKIKNGYKRALAKSKKPRSLIGDRFIREVGEHTDLDGVNINDLPTDRVDKFTDEKLPEKFGVEKGLNDNFDKIEGRKSSEESSSSSEENSSEEKFSKEKSSKEKFSKEKFSEENAFSNEKHGENYYPEYQGPSYGSYDEYPQYHTRFANPRLAFDHDSPFFHQQFPFFQNHRGDHQQNFALSFDQGNEDPGVNINFAVDRQRNAFADEDHSIDATRDKDKQDLQENFETEEFNFDQNPGLREGSPTAEKIDAEGERPKTFHLPPLKPLIPSYPQPEYQNPAYFDPLKPENKKDLVKFLDKQKKLFMWPKPNTDKIYNKKDPKEIYKPKPVEHYHSEEKKDPEYDSNHYAYSVPRPVPNLYPIKILPPKQGGKISKIFNIKHDGVDNLIELLHENGDLLFDMFRPITTHFDSAILHQLEHLNNVHDLAREAPEEHDVPQGFVGAPLQPPDIHYEEIPTIHVDNNSKDPTVGTIIQIPNNYYNNLFGRYARSVDNEEYLKTLLKEGAKIFNFLKKMGHNDEKVRMITRLGEEVLTDLKNKLDKKIQKRSVPVTPLLIDPSTKIDVSKTLENLGTLAKTIFEHQDTPMLHVRNLVGSTKDTLLATLKIPNQNFITPSGYDIVENPNKNEVLQSEIPDFSSRFGEGGEIKTFWPEELVTSTFQQVGHVIRNSVRSSQEAINHVGEITNHAKKAIYSAKKAPEIIMQSITPIPLMPATQNIGIASRFGGEDDTVGDVEKKPEGKFINMGHLLDAVGISNPVRPLPESSDDEGYANKIWKNLNGVKDSLGFNDIHDFIVQMKEKLQEFKDNNPLTIKRIQCAGKRFKRNIDDQYLLETPFEEGTEFDSPQDTLGISFIPQGLTHPFLNLQPFMLNSNIQPDPTEFFRHAEGRTAHERNLDDKFREFLKPAPAKCPFAQQFGTCPINSLVSEQLRKLSLEQHLAPFLGESNPEMMEQQFKQHNGNSDAMRSAEEDFKQEENQQFEPIVGQDFYSEMRPEYDENGYPFYK